jgi:glycosyltransferase involved in cell wall biosynthesis
MKLSIVTVVRNDLSGLIRTKQSLEALAASHFEWVIIDSSDNPINHSKLINQEGVEIVYRYQTPAGIYAAMNLGFSQSRGEWLWFLNAGDEAILDWKKLETIVHENYMNAGIAFPVRILSPKGRRIDVVYPEMKTNQINGRLELHANHQGFLFNRSFMPDHPYQLDFRFAADTELIDRLANQYSIKFEGDCLANFFINGGSGQNYRFVIKELERIRPEKYTISGAAKKFVYMIKNYIRLIILR